MRLAARCRKCGKVMRSERVDAYRVKMSCTCGFSDFRSVTERVKTVNPFYHRGSYTPFLESEKGKTVLTMQKANREHMEIISLEEISMLVSSDYDLPEVLQLVAQKIAQQLRVSVCSIYLMEDGSDELVLAATHGYDPAFVGKIRIRVGEGITGMVAKQREHIALNRASQDARYKNFPELQEERYNAMLSYPVTDKQELFGVINVNSTAMKTFSQDEMYFVSIIANLILSAVKLRKRVAAAEKGVA
ncbi:GAF domain-containing protein [Geomonas sp. RF6]|uniref:GAF domain-containing protein n=1 Tax=Geomonas sp. RF6 TaxID=2897342 RepID=UPI001E553DE3|nr:GAF domain-containing protein [Geomonas sp. RF6]UFS71267.1 GAF domain-containing protein [Geomonas sp. RF6]